MRSMNRPALAVAAVSLIAVTLSAQEPTRVVTARREATMRPEILGTHGIVAAGRH